VTTSDAMQAPKSGLCYITDIFSDLCTLHVKRAQDLKTTSLLM